MGRARRSLGEPHAVLRQFGDRADYLVESTGHHLVVADTQNHRRPVEDLRLVLVGDAQHVADDLQRQQARDLGDEVGLCVAMVGDHFCHDPVCPVPHTVLDTGHHLRREGSVDDLAQPKVTRVVEADHRAHELRDLGGHVGQCRAGRDGAEDLGVTTGMVDVIELRQCPMA